MRRVDGRGGGTLKAVVIDVRCLGRRFDDFLLLCMQGSRLRGSGSATMRYDASSRSHAASSMRHHITTSPYQACGGVCRSWSEHISKYWTKIRKDKNIAPCFIVALY